MKNLRAHQKKVLSKIKKEHPTPTMLRKPSFGRRRAQNLLETVLETMRQSEKGESDRGMMLCVERRRLLVCPRED